ncbi:MAG: hypothetical protein GY903_02050 [Fuerstiella sp.]|nr:hypothetical protein [Fuerstiella sp.]MCP4853262.1 hypothetical protein [Fuerstiella sp.]
MKQFVLTSIWLVALLLAWRSGAWSPSDSDSSASPQMSEHDRMFHMHQPLHEGGKVGMSGQYHLELVSHADGNHRLWISNAFRQEMDPAGFSGTLTVQTSAGSAAPVHFDRVGRTKELAANTERLQGQTWLIVDGSLGNGTRFQNMRFFWDYDAARGLCVPPNGLDTMVPLPADNIPTHARVDLGKDMFFDQLLSVDGSTSCASCHRPEYAFAEPDTVARGVRGRHGKRNTPTVLNTAYFPDLLWDGGRTSLEAQAVDPLLNPNEMANVDEDSLVRRLEQKYGRRTQDVMGQPLSLDSIAKALACYQRTLFSGDSDFDRFEAGQREAISQAAQRGRTLFFGSTGCGNCHIPPLFTDFEFHNLGVGWQGTGNDDPGRFKVTGEQSDIGAFRTPSLREAARTAPYMHDGSIGTLRAVVEFYNQGGRDNENRDALIAPLGLSSAEIDDLVEFIKTLDGRVYGSTQPSATKVTDGGSDL